MAVAIRELLAKIIPKRKAKDREEITQTLKRRDYLQQRKDRLNREVGFYLECVEERRRKDSNLKLEGIAIAALLVPFIEDLARRDGKSNNMTKKRERFLKNLGVESPRIFWEMYRDLLLHNNNIHAVIVDNKGVQPLMVYTDEKDEPLFAGPNVMNVGKLYRNLTKYLDKEIQEADEASVEEIPMAFRYNKNSQDSNVRALAAEIERVHETLLNGSSKN